MKRFFILFLILAVSVFAASCGVRNKDNDSDRETLTEITTETETETNAYTETETEEETKTTDAATETTAEVASGAGETEKAPETGAESADAVSAILEKMTDEEKVGQLFLCRNPKTEEDALHLVRDLHVGGSIFFARDFATSTPEKFRALVDKYDKNADIGLLTAVDEEGGSVCRVSLYKAFRDEKFASPAELYDTGGIDAITSDASKKSDFLLNIGINFNICPVADVSTDKSDFIYARSLGEDTGKTSEYVSAVVGEMNKKGIVSALKHFPGYGSCEDTHTGIAYDRRELSSLEKNDFPPFAAGIAAGAPIVLVSHNVVTVLDGDRPASLSEKVIDLLRGDFGFSGVVMTDDLSMGAIKDFTDGGDAAVSAVLAGCDLLCSSDAVTQYDAVLEALRNGTIPIERINEAAERILRLKQKYNILKEQ